MGGHLETACVRDNGEAHKPKKLNIPLTNSNQDLLGLHFADTVTVLDFDSVLVDKASMAMKIFHFVVVKISLINTIQALDISISLILETFPVEAVLSSIDIKPILLGLAQGFSNGGYGSRIVLVLKAIDTVFPEKE